MTHPSATPLWQSNSLDDLLAYANKKYTIEFTPLAAAGVDLQVAQIANMREMLDTVIAKDGIKDALNTLPLWAKVWPASLLLGHYLRHQNLTEHHTLEIGAGCGVVGLIAAALGSKSVVISDINEDALVFARINALKNNLGDTVSVEIADLETSSFARQFSLILGAEVLYLEHLYRPIVKFFKRHLVSANTSPILPEILLSADHRRKAKRFFKLAEKEYTIQQRYVGAKSAKDAGSEEKHLIALYRLIPFASQKHNTYHPFMRT